MSSSIGLSLGFHFPPYLLMFSTSAFIRMPFLFIFSVLVIPSIHTNILIYDLSNILVYEFLGAQVSCPCIITCIGA